MIQDTNYNQLQVAEYEIDRILKEIDKVCAEVKDKEDAKKIISEVWVPKMKIATEKMQEALTKWEAGLTSN
jgi:hypothetical protein